MEADDLPAWHVEFEMMCCHLASELGVDEIGAPLRRSLELLAKTVAAKTRAEHEHPTPIVHTSAGAAVRDCLTAEVETRERATLPTVPPVSYEDRPRARLVHQSLHPTQRGIKAQR